MFSFNVKKQLDYNIRGTLTNVRLLNPANPRITVFSLYSILSKAYNTDIPVVAFNKTLGDMKKIGIVSVIGHKREVFLSDDAWKEYAAGDEGRADIARELLRRLIAVGILPSMEEVTAELIDKGCCSNLVSLDGGDALTIFEWARVKTEAIGREETVCGYLRDCGVMRPATPSNEVPCE